MKIALCIYVLCAYITIVWSFQSKENSIINDLSWGTKLKILKEHQKDMTLFRRVGISFLRADDKDEQDEIMTNSEDNSMKIKLFRLMYETVRDSDLKVKRAELIKSYYNNDTSFEIGYIMGDITDKMNVMKDISITLKNLYSVWKPMEHINAYEQIANKAIEISHLTDMVRVIHKQSPTTI
ncbi:uncharacterized protein LOC123879720 [Maniola jurtina]|uniref:uncharacterized protein LOC123879720 n=1 Tax=Maniola jurtina TaxID=191418 RepID=UPI001E68B457|nr:uncharacterized protein LOC123879720 [Maniola jurtina]